MARAQREVEPLQVVRAGAGNRISALDDIVVVMASHIDSGSRLGRLDSCLQSIAGQSHAPRTMYLSASFAEHLEAALQRTLGTGVCRLRQAGCQVCLHTRKSKLSQFQHFESLLAEMSDLDEHNKWVLCSDDDDLWHPARLWTYSHGMQHHGAADVYESSVSAISNAALPAGALPSTSQFQLLDSSLSNYFNLCIRLRCWRRFFRETPAADLRSPYADVQLCYWLQRKAGERLVIDVEPGVWMYLWRQDEESPDHHVQRIETSLRPIVQLGLRKACSEEKTYLAAQSLYLAPIAKAERQLELWRVGVRHEPDLAHIHAALVRALQAEEREKEGQKAPQSADAGHPAKRAKKMCSELPGGDAGLGERLHAHIAAGVLQYEVLRQQAIAHRDWIYAQVEADDVCEAFCEAILDKGLLPQGLV